MVSYNEDEVLVPDGQLFSSLDMIWVDVVDAERCRLEDGTPYLKIGKSNVSQAAVSLEVTLDFWSGRIGQCYCPQLAGCSLDLIRSFFPKGAW